MSLPSPETGGMIALNHLESRMARLGLLPTLTDTMRYTVLQGLNSGFYDADPALHARALDAYYSSLPDPMTEPGVDWVGALVEMKP